jgi:hypothetical protein
MDGFIGLISAGTIAWGLLDVFFGYRFFKITLAIAGGLIGLVASGGVAGAMVERPAIATVLGVVGTLLGAALAIPLHFAVVFVAGFGSSAALALLLLANQHQMVAVAAGIVLGIIGGVVAVKLERIMIVLFTSLFGSLRAVLALTYFTSQIDWLFYVRQPKEITALLYGFSLVIPLTLILVLTVVGVRFQLGAIRANLAKEPKKKKDE